MRSIIFICVVLIFINQYSATHMQDNGGNELKLDTRRNLYPHYEVIMKRVLLKSK